jgi:hypothetical protein
MSVAKPRARTDDVSRRTHAELLVESYAPCAIADKGHHARFCVVLPIGNASSVEPVGAISNGRTGSKGLGAILGAKHAWTPAYAAMREMRVDRRRRPK